MIYRRQSRLEIAEQRLCVCTDEAIHEGLDAYSAYLKKCRQTPAEYKAEDLRCIMDGFEKVLFQHLDEEVESLRGEQS
jgi:hypothetical protein